LVWNDTAATTDPSVEAYASLGGSPTAAASCAKWDSDPEGVAVVTHEQSGFVLNDDVDVELHRLCLVAKPTSLTALPMVSALTTAGNGSRFVDGIIWMDQVSAPLPARNFGVWFSSFVPNNKVARFENSIVVAGSSTDESGGMLIGLTPPMPILFQGVVRIQDATVYFGNAASSQATYGVLSRGDVTEVYSSTLAGGPGTDESYGVFAQDQDTLRIVGSEVFGQGLESTTGVFVDAVDKVRIVGSSLYGYPSASAPTTVTWATGLHAYSGRLIDVMANDASYPDLDIVGAGAGVTASTAARGIYVESLQAGAQAGELTVVGPDTGSTARIRGGDSLLRSSGIEIETGIKLTVRHLASITAGRVKSSTSPLPVTQFVAAAIRLRGAGGEANIENINEIRGCDPACIDQGGAISQPEESPLLGIGLFADADTQISPPTKGAWNILVKGPSTIQGGSIEKTNSSNKSVAELIGIRALGDYKTGHHFKVEQNVVVRGSVATSPNGLPSSSAGVRLARSRFIAVAPVEIMGGPAHHTARGVWMNNAHTSGTVLPGAGATLDVSATSTDSFRIVGNPESADNLRPMAVYGVQDASNRLAIIANTVSLKAYLPTATVPWSAIEGGWAAINSQGAAVGASFSATANVVLEHVRMHGGVVPGGLVQSGLVMKDLSAAPGTRPVVNACLIEACGQVQGSSHHPDCHQSLQAFSVGAIIDAKDELGWPLLFSNNLVFGGFNTRAGGYGSIGMVATVDNDPMGATNSPARHFINNFFSGQGTTPTASCSAGVNPAVSEGLRLKIGPSSSHNIQTTVAAWRRNIFHDGGVACKRFAVSEQGIDADLKGIPFESNDYVKEIPGRDVFPVGSYVALYREAKYLGPIDHCIYGLPSLFPSCIDVDITNNTDYSNSLNVNPLFATSDVNALIDAPSLAVVERFFTKAPELNVGSPSSFVPRDFFDTIRAAPSTIGHYEQP
ncbi:MAG TPA: hypothetical protein PKW66_21495, partial [Polyangiaceae bacterium]|nr:hypothetical protein [Polyangiaceae bacterium]